MRDIYVDESATSGQRYMILGALIAPTDYVSEMVGAIRAVAEAHATFGELKWVKVSKAKLPLYLQVVDTTFNCIDAKVVEYHAIVIDTHRVNHGKYNEGSQELGYNKWAYQLLDQAAKRSASSGPFYVYMDNRSNALGLSDLRACLNNSFSRFSLGRRPFHRVVFRDSKTTSMLQACDLLTGALSFRLNGYEAMPGAAPHKRAMVERIAERAGLTTFARSTPFARNSFRIWHFKLSD